MIPSYLEGLIETLNHLIIVKENGLGASRSNFKEFVFQEGNTFLTTEFFITTVSIITVVVHLLLL